MEESLMLVDEKAEKRKVSWPLEESMPYLREDMVVVVETLAQRKNRNELAVRGADVSERKARVNRSAIRQHCKLEHDLTCQTASFRTREPPSWWATWNAATGCNDKRRRRRKKPRKSPRRRPKALELERWRWKSSWGWGSVYVGTWCMDQLPSHSCRPEFRTSWRQCAWDTAAIQYGRRKIPDGNCVDLHSCRNTCDELCNEKLVGVGWPTNHNEGSPVIASPLKHAVLKRDRLEEYQQKLQRCVGLVSFVGKKTVSSSGDAKATAKCVQDG